MIFAFQAPVNIILSYYDYVFFLMIFTLSQQYCSFTASLTTFLSGVVTLKIPALVACSLLVSHRSALVSNNNDNHIVELPLSSLNIFIKILYLYVPTLILIFSSIYNINPFALLLTTVKFCNVHVG